MPQLRFLRIARGRGAHSAAVQAGAVAISQPAPPSYLVVVHPALGHLEPRLRDLLADTYEVIIGAADAGAAIALVPAQVEAVTLVRARAPSAAVVVVDTGRTAGEVAARFLDAGADDYVAGGAAAELAARVQAHLWRRSR